MQRPQIVRSKIKKIVLVGRSEKFNKIVRQYFSHAEVILIPWRTSVHALKESNLSSFFGADLVLVCGYDYSSSTYDFNKYIYANVTSPLQVVRAIANPSTPIIYIDTLQGVKPFTLSRYQYAKHALGVALREHFSYFSVLNVPTIINQNGNVDVKGGIFTKLVFNTLNKMGILKTITTDELTNLLLSVLNNQCNKKYDFLVLQSKFLKIRRTLFLDRLLRFVGG